MPDERSIILALTLDEALALGRVLIDTDWDACIEDLEMTAEQAEHVEDVFDQLDTELKNEDPDWQNRPDIRENFPEDDE